MPEMVMISDVETVVAKAVKAAVSVMREEFEKLIKGLKDQIQSLQERIEHLENEARPCDVPDVTELSNTIEAVTRENRRISVAANEALNNITVVITSASEDLQSRRMMIVGKLFLNSYALNFTCQYPTMTNVIELAHPVSLRTQKNQASSSSDVVMVRFRHIQVRDQVIRQRKLFLKKIETNNAGRLRRHAVERACSTVTPWPATS